MLINSDDIKIAKEHLEVIQALIDGKEIEFKKLFTDDNYKTTANAPIWDFTTYKYRIKPLEPEYAYPIYKRLKETPETIVKFTRLDSGIYISTHDKSIYRPGNPALNMAPHTDSSWEDCTVSIDAEKIILGKQTTIELFEVISYCDITEEYSIRGSLYSNQDLENKKHLQKTGRSFIVNKETHELLKVKTKKKEKKMLIR